VGKARNQRKASRWEAQATAADCRALRRHWPERPPKLYWQIAYLNQLVAMADADIEYARRTLELARTKYRVGRARN